MARQEEIVFEILAEGGGIRIERIRNKNGEKFIYHHNEFDPTDEGLDVNEKGEYDNFITPFQLINKQYSWYLLALTKVNEEFREYVLTELIKKLQQHGVTPDEIRYSQNQLEETLNVKIEFGNPPLRNGIQDITIQFYNGTTTDFEYQNYSGEYYNDSKRNDDLKLFKKVENIDWKEIKCKGTIEFVGSTVIIKDEFKQPIYVFSSEKAFVTTKPILSQSKGWFYKTI